MPSNTPLLNFFLPNVGVDDDLWGGFLNDNWSNNETELVARMRRDTQTYDGNPDAFTGVVRVTRENSTMIELLNTSGGNILAPVIRASGAGDLRFIHGADTGNTAAQVDEPGTVASQINTIITREKGDARYFKLAGDNDPITGDVSVDAVIEATDEIRSDERFVVIGPGLAVGGRGVLWKDADTDLTTVSQRIIRASDTVLQVFADKTDGTVGHMAYGGGGPDAAASAGVILSRKMGDERYYQNTQKVAEAALADDSLDAQQLGGQPPENYLRSNINATHTGNFFNINGVPRIGVNGGGDSELQLFDDNSDVWRSLRWDNSANDWRIEDDTATFRVLYHAGNLDPVEVGGTNYAQAAIRLQNERWGAAFPAVGTEQQQGNANEVMIGLECINRLVNRIRYADLQIQRGDGTWINAT